MPLLEGFCYEIHNFLLYSQISYYVHPSFVALFFKLSNVAALPGIKGQCNVIRDHNEHRSLLEDHGTRPIAPYLCRVNIHTCQLAVKMVTANAMISVYNIYEIIGNIYQVFVTSSFSILTFSVPEEKVALPPFD